MIPDKVGQEPAAHAEEKTGRASLQVPEETAEKHQASYQDRSIPIANVLADYS